jgi:hypothetical protein
MAPKVCLNGFLLGTRGNERTDHEFDISPLPMGLFFTAAFLYDELQPKSGFRKIDKRKRASSGDRPFGKNQP